MRGATRAVIPRYDRLYISIHTPHAGSDMTGAGAVGCITKFQSTLPMRGATKHTVRLLSCGGYFNPHSPCGERQHLEFDGDVSCKFQSTLPMRGATSGSRQEKDKSEEFQSTLPMRGATMQKPSHISHNRNFNPHSPCGERLPVIS